MESETKNKQTDRGKLGFRCTAREYELLAFILEQKFGDLDALYPRFFESNGSRSTRYAAERLQLLRRHGFLRAQAVYTSPKLFYIVTPLGRDLLESQRIGVRLIETQDHIDFRTFEHDRRVTLCRAYREKSGHAKEWLSERRLKAEWALMNGKLAREYCPDAIYTNQRGERVAFELELAPKTRERHSKKISRFLDVMRNKEGPFQRTLFVACDESVRSTLLALTRPYPESFKVLGFEQIARPHAAQVLRPAVTRQTPPPAFLEGEENHVRE